MRLWIARLQARISKAGKAMSKDFELLRKAELAGKRSPIILSRETVPWFTGLPKPVDAQARVSPSEYPRLSARATVKRT
jgi:hypothetical protein